MKHCCGHEHEEDKVEAALVYEMHERAYSQGVQATLEKMEWKRDVLKANLSQKGVFLVGRCPFHQEKTPSLIYHPLEDTFICISCGEEGTGFELAEEYA